MSNLHKFPVTLGDGQSVLALSEEMCEKIKDVVRSYNNKVPLALAIGVLHIAAKEIMENNDE